MAGVVLLLAAVYLFIGVAFAEFASWTTANPETWRRLAWLVSAAAFAAHIGYEHFRLNNPPRTTARRASIAAAIGACGLAVMANVHGWIVGSNYRGRLAIALVAWPLLTAVPAFLAALVTATALNRWRAR